MAAKTLPERFLETVIRHADRPAYATQVKGEYQSITWAQTKERVLNVAGGLRSLGIEAGDRVGILSPNRFEWMLADMGSLFCNAWVVPVYPTLPAGQAAQILFDSGCRLLFVSDSEQLQKIREKKEQLPQLSILVGMPGLKAEGLLGWDELEEKGRAWREEHPGRAEQEAHGHDPDSPFTLIYTSGTTGTQKGVMLSHTNILSNVDGARETFPVREEDRFLSFLPLSHVFERLAGYYYPLCVGAEVCYARDMTTVGEDLLRARPTIMISVPRLFEKIHARILENVEKGPKSKRRIFNWALGVGQKVAALTQQRREPAGLLALKYRVADKLVYSKIREKTGGRLRFMVSGGAPLARHLGDFFLSAGMRIVEGYGLTESSPVITANTVNEFRFGTVGRPFPGVEVRIAEDGEILARGPNIMLGYYNNPEETAQAIREGWLYTGDIGHIGRDGFLRITDRKKNLIVTSGGKNVAPQPIEKALCASPLIEQCMLIGDKRNFISALIVPSFDRLREELGEEALASTDELSENPAVYKRIGDEIERHSADLARYEKVRRFVVLGSEFTIDAGELTPKLEVKRHFIMGKYHDLIEGMYDENASGGAR